MTVGRVEWAVPPGATKAYTRPALLVEQLLSLGVIQQSAVRVHHSRSNAEVSAPGESVRVSSLTPWRNSGQHAATAVLSPLFLSGAGRKVAWIDAYDDWSLAPDINRYHRLLARRAYANLRAHRADGVITVNSPYMRGMVGRRGLVVPNGVDPSISTLAKTGDDRTRLVVLGHFFEGRTDFALIEAIASTPGLSEVVIGSPGTSRAMIALLARLKRVLGDKLVTRNWMSVADLASISGARTIALIPHLVKDYTLSQDPMKTYMFQALGIPVVIPRMLWPRHLDPQSAFLVDFGVHSADLQRWMDHLPQVSDDWRREFAAENSWNARAMSIAGIIA